MADPEDIERVEVELRKDFLLTFFVELVNRTPGAEIGMTLMLPSGAVTGLLISRAIYLEELGQLLTRGFEAFGPDAAKAIGRLFADAHATALADLREENTQEREADVEGVEYLHMRGARLVQGATFVPNEGALVRIRLRDVSGFIFGELGLHGA